VNSDRSNVYNRFVLLSLVSIYSVIHSLKLIHSCMHCVIDSIDFRQRRGSANKFIYGRWYFLFCLIG